MHEPPAHVVSQVPVVLQAKSQLPPRQSKVQSASSRQLNEQPPPSQVKLQVELPAQVTSHTAPKQEPSQVPVSTQLEQPPLTQSAVQTSPP